MPSIGHIAVGMAAGQAITPSPTERWRWMVWCVGLSCAADLDFIPVILGVPYDSLWGHRGVSHSLAAALLAGGVTAFVARRLGRSSIVGALSGFLVYASHSLFDSFSIGSHGVPWFWPFTTSYFFLPGWIPSVNRVHEFLTPRAFPVLAAELMIFAPFLAYTWLRGRRAAESPKKSEGEGLPLLPRQWSEAD
jgi:inner membrane protein